MIDDFRFKALKRSRAFTFHDSVARWRIAQKVRVTGQAMDKAELIWRNDQRIPSEPNNCLKVITLVLEQLEKLKWNNKDTFGIHMAMEEAIMNAIQHGNACAPDKTVHVVVEIFDDRFYAKITDQGCGFDPDALPDPTDEENLEKDCGRGVMLILNFVDVVVYNAKGNSVELTKHRTEFPVEKS